MCVVTLSLSISNNIDSPVDVGGFAEPRKILCQCAFPPLSNYQYTPVRAWGCRNPQQLVSEHMV